MRGLQRQRFKDEHVQRALDEITRFVRHKGTSPDYQEEEYLPLPLIVKRRTAALPWIAGLRRG
jgi:hypothetical protein